VTQEAETPLLSSSRTPSSLTAERWTFTESTKVPTFEHIDSVGRPEQVFATPDGKTLVVVDNQRTFELRTGSKISSDPRPELAWPYARISPRGGHIALVEALQGRAWELGSNVSVLRSSDHSIVATFEGGADPHWIAEGVLAFRVGNQAQRLSLPDREAKTVGPAQSTHGCPNAALRGYTRVDESMCPGRRYSRVLAVDPAYTKWLVVDDDGAHETALRIVGLASGRERVIADRTTHAFPLYVEASPTGRRFCMTPKISGSYRLFCGRFPEGDDLTELADLGADRLPRTDWLDDDRFLVAEIGIVDLARGKRIELDTKIEHNFPPRLDGTLGPRYVVADTGWTYLLDLEQRTSTRIDVDAKGTREITFAEAVAAGRFWVTRSDPKTLRSALYEMRL
jgi:hypothetical protein